MFYIEKFITNIRSVSGLIPRIFLIYNKSLEKVGLNFSAAIINDSRILVLACHQCFCVGLWMNGEKFEIF